ncbi:hypothetical protein RRG08_046371 [Elysia crispata]|uniref:C-type lectin domain-containing protein n=1 Tax=Elysia crispata TaxID=231223 RepID=A0AAE1AWV5_9GAST|nr:hypothetical protein RRG08_046371 [Elysia crispata]
MNKLCSDLALWISCACLLYYSYYCFGSEISTICPQGWIISLESRSCVKRSYEKKSWDQARKECQSVGADLLINYNRGMEKLLSAFYSSRLWVGLNDLKQLGVYRWLDKNEQFDFLGTDCPNNTYGPNCALTCSPGCGGKTKTCDNFTGYCTDRCKDGYLTDRCDETCRVSRYGPGCTKTCSQRCGGRQNLCNHTNGFCTDGCDPHYEGEMCDRRICNPRCGGPSNTCNNSNGFCMNGCDEGYQGKSCESPCTNNTFGLNCLKICSENCAGPNNTCDHVSGFCTSGCDEGYQGARCLAPPKKFLASDVTTMSGALMFLLLFLILVVMALRRKKKNPATSHEAEEKVFTSQEKQDDIAPVGAVGFLFGDRRVSLPDRSVSAVHEDVPVGTSSHDDDDDDDDDVSHGRHDDVSVGRFSHDDDDNDDFFLGRHEDV